MIASDGNTVGLEHSSGSWLGCGRHQMLTDGQSEKWQGSGCQRHGAGERMMDKDELQRQTEEGSWSQDP